MRLFEHLRSRPGLNTALGVALAIVAGVTLLGYVAKASKSGKGGKMVPVQYARTDISVGAPITRGMLERREVPESYVVPGSVKDSGEIAGARAARKICKGEPVTSTAIAGGSGAANLASRIPADMRAYSIQLREGTSGASDLRPGDMVDVLSTSGDQPRTSTILAGKTVLSVCTETSDGQDPVTAPGSITLLVSPVEAELLAQAVSVGEISVSLCPAGDEGQAMGK